MLLGSEICNRGKSVARLVLKCPVMQRRVESPVMRRFLSRHRSVSLAIDCYVIIIIIINNYFNANFLGNVKINCATHSQNPMLQSRLANLVEWMKQA